MQLQQDERSFYFSVCTVHGAGIYLFTAVIKWLLPSSSNYFVASFCRPAFDVLSIFFARTLNNEFLQSLPPVHPV